LNSAYAQAHRNVATACRIMQVGPPCAIPCGGCKNSPQFRHDHWGAVERYGVCGTCLDGQEASVNDHEEMQALLASHDFRPYKWEPARCGYYLSDDDMMCGYSEAEHVKAQVKARWPGAQLASEALAEMDAEAAVPSAEEIQALRDANDEAIKTLVAQGMPITITNVNAVRLQELIDFLFGSLDNERRRAFEAQLQNKFAELIQDARREQARLALLSPSPVLRIVDGNGHG
jgi:hypothetical protein